MVSVRLGKPELIILSPLCRGLCSALDMSLNSKWIGGELKDPSPRGTVGVFDREFATADGGGI